jgi:hypothetical protein
MSSNLNIMKRCFSCKKDKPFDEFHKSSIRKDGLSSRCKECAKIYRKQHHLKNLQKDKQKSKEWRERNVNHRKQHYQENRDRILSKSKDYYKNNPDAHRNYLLKTKYGITLEEYNRLLEKQNGVCAICHQKSNTVDKRSGKIKMLAVDHNHKTGKIRGLLCEVHNRALGMFHDDIGELKSAIDYLIRA